MMIWKILIAVAFVGPQGPSFGNMNESAKFKSEQECKDYGEAIKPRAADWVRGRLNVDWDFPVSVAYRCEIDGEPA